MKQIRLKSGSKGNGFIVCLTFHHKSIFYRTLNNDTIKNIRSKCFIDYDEYIENAKKVDGYDPEFDSSYERPDMAKDLCNICNQIYIGRLWRLLIGTQAFVVDATNLRSTRYLITDEYNPFREIMISRARFDPSSEYAGMHADLIDGELRRKGWSRRASLMPDGYDDVREFFRDCNEYRKEFGFVFLDIEQGPASGRNDKLRAKDYIGGLIRMMAPTSVLSTTFPKRTGVKDLTYDKSFVRFTKLVSKYGFCLRESVSYYRYRKKRGKIVDKGIPMHYAIFTRLKL